MYTVSAQKIISSIFFLRKARGRIGQPFTGEALCPELSCKIGARMMHIKRLRTLYSKLRRPLFLVRVSGESMWPELVAGRRYFGTALGKIRIGDYAVFRYPGSQEKIFVKKVKTVSNDCYEMSSTVSWGSSSKDFGNIPRSLILGKIVRFFS